MSVETDRELLELVAKAAGVGPIRGFDYGFGDRGAAVLIDTGSAAAQRWNPLTDDGDALRLAVKLKIRIGFRPCAYADTPAGMRFFGARDGDDQFSRTRLAIVRAAAEIGRAMP